MVNLNLCYDQTIIWPFPLYRHFLAVSPQYSRANTAIQVPTRICVLSNCNFKTATPHSARCREGESHSRGLVLIIAIIVDVEKQDALMNSRPVTFVCLSLTLSSNWKRHKRKIPLDCPGDERIDNSFMLLRDAILVFFRNKSKIVSLKAFCCP